MVAKSCRGCGHIGKPLCDECRNLVERRRGRPSASQRGYDAEYRRNRLVVVDQAKRGRECVICGLGFCSTDLITAEHIVPIRQGGNNAKNNLGPAHTKCNYGWNRKT
jgi:5-methylcytosine-specific restriction endonuclease McrA